MAMILRLLAPTLWLSVGLPLVAVSAESTTTPQRLCQELAPSLREECMAAAELLMQEPAPRPPFAVHLTATGGKLALRYVLSGPTGDRVAECGSPGTIALPADQSVRLLLTAGDGIHTLRIPDQRIAVDLIPGRINEAWIANGSPAGTTNRGVIDQDRGASTPMELRFMSFRADRPDLHALCRAVEGSSRD